jgi:adenylate cyclase
MLADRGEPIDLGRETDFVLDHVRVRPALREVSAGGHVLRLQPRVMQVLVAIARAGGEVVSRDELVSSCWGGLVVGDDAVNRCIGQLRRLIDKAAPGALAIETLPRVGYRLARRSGGSETERTPPGRKPIVAVLPFANMSGDPEQDYFADGMLVEIVEALSRSRSIIVLASGSSLSFKGKDVSARDAARQLGARYVLEGSVRKAGGRVRIGAQLIDGVDGALIWTHRFEDSLEDVFALQDKMALAVAGAIDPTVQEAEIRRLAAQPTGHVDGYDLYLRAMPGYRSGAKTGILQSLDLLGQAIALDPAYGPALALAAHCHRMIYVFGWSADPEAHRSEGLALADRALKAAGNDPEVLATVANVLTFLGGEPEVAVGLIDRAIALNPGSSRAWFMGGPMLLRIGDTERGVAHLETALRLDPFGPFRAVQIGFLGQARFQQGRFSDAVTLLRESLHELENARAYALLAACLGHLSRVGEAKSALGRYHALTDRAVGETARLFMNDPAQLELFLDGVALAEGKSPAH